MNATATPPTDRAPLAGVRVIDAGIALAAPLAGHFLGHFGADVIKVEPPEGDYARHAGGAARHPGMNPFTLHTNREKRSLALDLKTAQGQDVLARLVRNADVFLHNFRPDAAARLGVAWEAIAEINPKIIHVHVVGFGTRGRYAGLPAYDDIIQSAVALPQLMARLDGGEPLLVPMAWVDRLVSITAYGHIATALYGRAQDGLGRRIEVPMFEVAAHLVLSDHLYLRTFRPALGPAGHFRLLDPNRKPHRTADGYLCAMPTHDRHWAAIFSLAGRPELLHDPRYCNMRQRMAHIEELTSLLARLLATRTTAEWVEALRAADVPVMPAVGIDELVDDPHLADVGFLEPARHPTEGDIFNLRLPGDWSDWQPGESRPAPRCGEHSREVLAEAGYSMADIEELIEAGISLAPHEEVKAR
ncbi:CoA transferase [Ramlibacter sp. AW1]|uniref:CoA transferase n=1 Tax=Ramlibacter aurantiacus TaxID=2801330 RepID=A0A936ZN68_9BURK|nr:CoA transferase [Ramlibacter aurantiacus]MBL0419306.1 CoA transferase [Ramlibacter aurantiacus]